VGLHREVPKLGDNISTLSHMTAKKTGSVLNLPAYWLGGTSWWRTQPACERLTYRLHGSNGVRFDDNTYNFFRDFKTE
jgi:hypothetical protein